jgi:hypothetical protein
VTRTSGPEHWSGLLSELACSGRLDDEDGTGSVVSDAVRDRLEDAPVHPLAPDDGADHEPRYEDVRLRDGRGQLDRIGIQRSGHHDREHVSEMKAPPPFEGSVARAYDREGLPLQWSLPR